MNIPWAEFGMAFTLLMMGVALAMLLVSMVLHRTNRQLEQAKVDAQQRECRQRTIAELLSMLVGNQDRHEVMSLALKTICSHLGASRCYLLRHDQRRREVRLVSEILSDPGRQKATPADFRMKLDPKVEWYKELGSNEWLFVPDVTDPEAVRKWGLIPEYNQMLGINSLYALKFMVGGRYWGNIGVTYEGRAYVLTDEERDFLETCCRFFSVAVERIEAEEELKAERDNAVSAERAKSVFFAMVSHDIRTPLNAVIGFSELLKAGVEEEAVRKRYLDSIILSGKTLLQLINDVLDLSRLDAGHMEIHPEPTDCRRLVNGVALAFEAEASGKNLAIVTRTMGVPPLMVDPQRVRQILFNFVGNAVKFTDRGSIELRMTFLPDEGGCSGTLTLAVIDTGRGIAQENIAKLLQPYVRLDECKDRPGTGLGLSICHRLARQMGGRIQVESKPGKGSTFMLTLTGVKPVDAAEVRERNIGPVATGNAPTRQPRVLAVDDAPLNLSVLVAMLKRVGVTEVVTAADGFEALEAMRKHQFDLVLTDLWMPQMDGETLLRAIRSDTRFERLPVYAVTADVEAQKKASSEDFTGLLLKPLTVPGLRQLLNEWRQKVECAEAERTAGETSR